MTMTVEEALKELTIEEKAGLCSGEGSWDTKAVPRLGIPAFHMTDGPCGVRSMRRGQKDAAPATCFPAPALLACSFDPQLLFAVGRAIGAECRALGTQLLLAPGVNIKRSPLGGRNFEYFSEDPLLAGLCAAGFIRGVQSQGVGTALKHFALNNQENWRLVSDSIVDEATMREIYLRPFEIAVKLASPAAVMTSYNRINGTYAGEHTALLTGVLRGEWGYDGLVVSDWGAVSDRVAALRAGTDLEMPGSAAVNDPRIVQAVREKRLEPAVLDAAAARVLTAGERLRGARLPRRESDGAGRHWPGSADFPADAFAEADRHVPGEEERLCAAAGQPQGLDEVKRPVPDSEDAPPPFDRDAHHALARRAAAESAVLLENHGVLPLTGTPAVIGRLALHPHLQGGGSAHVNPTVRQDFCAVCRANGLAPAYAPGWPDREHPEEAPALLEEARRLAQSSGSVVLFLGTEAQDESEGFDRQTLQLPAAQQALARAVPAVNRNTVVVVQAGGVVDLACAADAGAILYTCLSGQAGCEALYDLLFGAASPCGKLAESVPLRLEDTPCFAEFGRRNTRYTERAAVGYRYYDAAEKPVRWPFGHGLTYSEFALRAPQAEAGPDGIAVSGVLANTGARAAAETVQLYAAAPGCGSHVLCGFIKLRLEPGEERPFSLTVPYDTLARFNTTERRFMLPAGACRIEWGFSSRDIRHSQTVQCAAWRGPRLETELEAYGEPCPDACGDLCSDACGDLRGDACRDACGNAPARGNPPACGNPLASGREEKRFHLNSTVADLLETPIGALLFQKLSDELEAERRRGEIDENFYHMYLAQIRQYALRTFVLATHGKFSWAMLERLLQLLHEPEPDMEEAAALLKTIRVI